MAENARCGHDFQYRAVCVTCGADALHLLEGRIAFLEQEARAAVGHLVLGDRAKAEAVLRASVLVGDDELPTQTTQAPSATPEK